MVSVGWAPLATKTDCCPASLPATLVRSTRTPGTVFRMAQGSRPWGTWASSSLVRVVEVPTRFVSTAGVSAVMVTVSSTVASFRPKAMFAFWPVFTMTSRVTVAKPLRLTVSL